MTTVTESTEAIYQGLREAHAVVEGLPDLLAVLDDPERLAVAREVVRELRRMLGECERDLTRMLADSMPQRRVETSAGVLERRPIVRRKEWDQDLAPTVMRRLASAYNVDVDDAMCILVDWPASFSWRVTGLRELGIEPGEWCREDDGGVEVGFVGDVAGALACAGIVR